MKWTPKELRSLIVDVLLAAFGVAIGLYMLDRGQGIVETAAGIAVILNAVRTGAYGLDAYTGKTTRVDSGQLEGRTPD